MCSGLYQMKQNVTPLLLSGPTLTEPTLDILAFCKRHHRANKLKFDFSFQILQFYIVREHSLNDKTTAQARVQMQIVTQLEVQLKKEKVKMTIILK